MVSLIGRKKKKKPDDIYFSQRVEQSAYFPFFFFFTEVIDTFGIEINLIWPKNLKVYFYMMIIYFYVQLFKNNISGSGHN